MGWTKHPDAVLAHRERLMVVRRELRKMVGKRLRSKKRRTQALLLLAEYHKLQAALGYGRCSGQTMIELGVRTAYTSKSFTSITVELLETGPETYTFVRKRCR